MNIQSNIGKTLSKTSEKRKAIFDATLKLVSKNGFHGTSMAMISKETGFSAGIIYHYFEGKDALINELYKELKKNVAARVQQGHDPNQPLIIQLRSIWEAMIRYHFENPVESAFMDQYSKSPYYSHKVEEEVLKHFSQYTELVEKGKAEKIIKNFPIMVFHAFSVDVASSLVQKSSLGMLDLNEDLVKNIIEAAWQVVKI